MRTFWVFCGSLREFHYYVHEVLQLQRNHAVVGYSSGTVIVDGEFRYKYLSDPDQLRGQRNFSVIRYGTWLNRTPRDLDLLAEIEKHKKLSGDLV